MDNDLELSPKIKLAIEESVADAVITIIHAIEQVVLSAAMRAVCDNSQPLIKSEESNE